MKEPTMSLREHRWQWKKKHWHRDPYEFKEDEKKGTLGNRLSSLPALDRMGTLVIKDPKTKNLHLIGTM